MILADKILLFRKKNNWSQEEFANKMNVSRQAVSKWEQGQSIPDLDKILLMASLFGVTTDYLLKDDIETEEFTNKEDYEVNRISLEAAQDFIALKEESSKWIALGVLICILSAIPLIASTDDLLINAFNITEEVSLTIGLSLTILLVAIAVFIFISNWYKVNKYEYLDTEIFEPEYGVISFVKQRQEAFRPIYNKYNLIGVLLCIIGALPLIITSMLNNSNLHIGLFITLFIVSIAVFLFVSVGVRWSAYSKILQEGEYSTVKKESSKMIESIAGVYWTSVVAIYVIIGFTTKNWKNISIFPISALIFGALAILIETLTNHRKK